MSVSIKYGNYNFENQPTPFVTRSEGSIVNGEKWGTREVFTLRGKITGCNFEYIRSGQKDLISGFGQDFQNLSIINTPNKIPESMFVVGAGVATTNGIYLRDGTWNGKPRYTLTGGTTEFDSLEYRSNDTRWAIYNTNGVGSLLQYTTFPTTVDTPDLAGYFNALENNLREPYPYVRLAEKADFGTGIFLKSGLKVESINFPSNKYVGALDYEIQLSHYPADYFQTQYGVLNPVDSWEFNEGEDGLLNITHNISCKGFATNSDGSNGLQNAIDFVHSRTGNSNMVNPHFICKNTYPDFYPCLDSFSETIDRVGANYSITENYISDLQGSGYGVLRYTIDLNENRDSFSTATINGRVDGCKNQSMSQVRSRYEDVRLFDLVSEAYDDYFGSVELNPLPLNSQVQEDLINKKLTFGATYNNDNSPSTSLDVQTSVTDQDGFISVVVNGVIRGRGDIYDRIGVIDNKYAQLDIFSLANDAYVNFLDNDVQHPLNPTSKSNSKTRDTFTPSISFSATYENDEIPPEGFESFDRNISFSPSLRKIKPVPLFDRNGDYDIIDLLVDRRARINVNLNGIAKPDFDETDLVATLKSEATFLLQKYGLTTNLKLESYNVVTGNFRDYKLNATWSFDTTNKVIVGSNYDTVSTLKLK